MKKNEKCVYHQVNQIIQYGVTKRREGKERRRKIFEESMAENLTHLLKNNNLHIRKKSQNTLSGINTKRFTKKHRVKDAESQRQGGNAERGKRKITHYLQGSVNKLNN